MDCDNWDIPKILIFFYKYNKTLIYRIRFMMMTLYHWKKLIYGACEI